MLFKLFTEQVKKAVLEKLGEGYKAEIATVVQNNGVKAVKLSICREGEQVACSVCLDTIYSRYFLGKITIEQAAEEIFSVYQKPNGLASNIEENTLRNWNQVKDKVCYRLVQFDKNCGELRKRPYRLYADLAVVYYLLLAKEGDGMFTVAIMTQHMLAWGVGEEELYLQASKNTPVYFPMTFTPMHEMLDLPLEGTEELGMYVLSNCFGGFGSSVVLYEGSLKAAAEQLNGDLILMPSSVHEFIVVKYNPSLSVDSLREMVREINETEVSPEDQLSDQVYRYRKNGKAIEIME